MNSARIAKARLLWLRDGGAWMSVAPGRYWLVNVPLGPRFVICLRRAVYRWMPASHP